ncbi:uncharacterized protein [Primulina eburnea]|uniref:uncharacterized protein n=1 Tax=Primulina eburnea TaxID=1245227 RepID=UPI003C6BFD11
MASIVLLSEEPYEESTYTMMFIDGAYALVEEIFYDCPGLMLVMGTDPILSYFSVRMATRGRGSGRGRGRPRIYIETPMTEENPVEQVVDQFVQITMDEIVSRFQKLRPTRFFGTEDAEKSESWLKDIEYLFSLMEYTDNQKYKLALYQLKDRARDWWEATKMGLDEQGIEVSWTVFKTQFTEKFSPPSYYTEKENKFNSLRQRNMSVAEYASTFTAMLKYAPHVAANPKAKHNRFVNGLNNNIYTYVVSGLPTGFAEAVERAKNAEAGLKRGSASFVPPGSRSTTQQNLKAKGKMFKKSGSASSSFSGYRQQGESQITTYSGPYCNRCRGRHVSEQCIGVMALVGNVVRKVIMQEFAHPRTMFHNLSEEDFVEDLVLVEARVLALTEDQAQEAPGSVIAGNCSVSGYPARVLFDTGASHSFISESFITSHSLTSIVLPTSISVATPMGKIIMSTRMILDCVLNCEDNELHLNLIVLPMQDFDCIVGMDTLKIYRATIDCFHGIVRFRPNSGTKWNFYGKGSRAKIPLISSLEMSRLLFQGNEGYLVYAIDNEKSESTLSEIPVVNEFRDIFPDEIPGFPPPREIEFSIELISRTIPISKAPYRMAPLELKN